MKKTLLLSALTCGLLLSTTNIQADMNTIYLSLVRGADSPDLIMADTTWTNDAGFSEKGGKNNRLKFAVGGVLLLAAVVFLVVNKPDIPMPLENLDGALQRRFDLVFRDILDISAD